MKLKNSDLKIKTYLTNNLGTNIIREILKLKKKHYKYSLKDQKSWFDKNIKEYDIHILLFFKKKLIGYNCLRNKSSLIYKKKKLSSHVFIFDTLLIDSKFRNLGLSSMIIKKSIFLIKKKRYVSVLMCLNKMTKYYEKFGWKIFSSRDIKFEGFNKKNKKIMIFEKNANYKNSIKKITIFK